MATELNIFDFTDRSDLAQDLNDGLANTGNFVDTLLGNDTLEGAGGDIGLNNSGIIDTGKGDDSINADATTDVSVSDAFSGEIIGNGINNDGSIDTGKGDDSITADATIGVNVSGISLRSCT